MRTAGSTETTFLRLPPDGQFSVYQVFITKYDQTGKPMRLTVTVYPTDRNEFIVNVGDVPET